MRIRVVGGPIRRTDRVVVAVTSHSTFESILATVNAHVEALDLAELAAEVTPVHFHPESAQHTIPSEERTGDHQDLAATSNRSQTPFEDTSTAEFGTQVEETGGSSESEGSTDEDDPPTKQAAKRRTDEKVRQESPRGCIPPPTGAESAATAPRREAPECLRLSKYAIDAEHYDVCLFEMDGDSKGRVTKVCHPSDTPRTVGMRIPAIALVLKKKYREAGVTIEGLQTALNTVVAAAGGAGSPSPQLPQGDATSHVTPHREVPASNEERGWSRAQSFRNGSLSQDPRSSILERLAALYRVHKHESYRYCQLQRLMKRAGAHVERLLEVACSGLQLRDRPVTGQDSFGQRAAYDAPMTGITFELQRLRDFTAEALMQLDALMTKEGSVLSADMLVHAAPMGEEKSFAAVYLSRFIEDQHDIHTRKAPTLSGCFGHSDAFSGGNVEACEQSHRELLLRCELYSHWKLERASLALQCSSKMEETLYRVAEEVQLPQTSRSNMLPLPSRRLSAASTPDGLGLDVAFDVERVDADQRAAIAFHAKYLRKIFAAPTPLLLQPKMSPSTTLLPTLVRDHHRVMLPVVAPKAAHRRHADPAAKLGLEAAQDLLVAAPSDRPSTATAAPQDVGCGDVADSGATNTKTEAPDRVASLECDVGELKKQLNDQSELLRQVLAAMTHRQSTAEQ